MDPIKHITYNTHVLLRLPSNNIKLCELRPNSDISLGKFGAFKTNDIIGYPFGTTFEIHYDNALEETIPGPQDAAATKNSKNKFKIPVGTLSVLESRLTANGGTNGAATGLGSEEETTPNPELQLIGNSESNKNLINVGNSIQKLSMAEIELLKKQTATGEEIINKMIEAHGSFHQKTVFSQEKYLKRKKQKFAKFFTVEYLSSSGLLQYLLDKGDTVRAMDMSEESIGMILSLGNIKSNGTYLCVDETGGLLVYALLERMFGGENTSNAVGKVIVVHENEHANLDLLKFSNYSEDFIQNHVKTVSILDYFEPPVLAEVQDAFTPLSDDQLKLMKSNKKGAYYRRLKWYNSQIDIIDWATKQHYDGLVVASTLHLSSLIPRLGERVHGSRPIVCYSQFKETVLELSHTLYSDLRFLAPTIMETRCRPFQTIRGRLHPLMTMRGGGGYVMWCHKVIPVLPSDVRTPAPLVGEPLDESEAKKQKIE
ncbi:LANO_0H07536g1_1 [Lachancea nothofagi CBS 11611]|uniref:tRNA (adenine(58)-N(1))-methyltransferase non-catalytic subunit TRM6 n=1 Tax=Lachancea nothofagi CBS 11611 TaxID=1266666 RepID=A0A1G4KLT8_9SACH|nr:LANO_0H07536g1_1 [Lachancea nothofagi CBS 11611]